MRYRDGALRSRIGSFLVIFAAGWLAALGATGLDSRSATADSPAIDFAHEVVPILQAHCAECHGGDKAEGGFSINTRSLMIDAGVVEPGDPDISWMIELVSSTEPDAQMPPSDRERVPEESIGVLVRWVEAGMPWEEGFTFAADRYEPTLQPRRPELPPVEDGRTNPIDRFVDAYLAKRDLPRPRPIDDAAFLRRVHLDLIGLPPTPKELQEFLTDPSSDKRSRLIDDLLDRDEDFATHWLTFWNDLLRNAYTGTGYIDGGRKQVTAWLYRSLLENKPFDQFVRELIAPSDNSEGFIRGIQWRGDVSASQTREVQFAQNLGQVFLGINLKCASCHDSFIDRWTLSDAYSLAAVYATEPLELHRCETPQGTIAEAGWIFPELGSIDPAAPRSARLRQLAALMTHPENGRLTRTLVNRLWHRLMGRGIVHPVDAMGTEPWHEDLLDYLAVYFADHDYDQRAVLRLIANSEAYQSQCAVVEEQLGEEQRYVYTGPLAKRMTVEQFLDAVGSITATWPEPDRRAFRLRNDQPGGQLAAVLTVLEQTGRLPATDESPTHVDDDEPKWRARWGDRPIRAALTPLDLFQASLGRPNREQVVTSRPGELTTLEAILLANGQPLAELLSRAAGNVLVREFASAEALIDWLYLAALSRPPTKAEREVLNRAMSQPPTQQEVEDLLWNVFMLPEFQLVR